MMRDPYSHEAAKKGRCCHLLQAQMKLLVLQAIPLKHQVGEILLALLEENLLEVFPCNTVQQFCWKSGGYSYCQCESLLISCSQRVFAGIGEPPTDWPKDLPHPEALSPANAKEADDVSELVGGYIAAALYSKSWQLREAGLNHLQAYLVKLVRSSPTFMVHAQYRAY